MDIIKVGYVVIGVAGFIIIMLKFMKYHSAKTKEVKIEDELAFAREEGIDVTEYESVLQQVKKELKLNPELAIKQENQRRQQPP